MPKVINQFKLTHSHHDGNGNAMLLYQEPVYGNMKITLRLAGETREKNIAEISTNLRVMTVKRVKSKHYFHKAEAYGFNYELMFNPPSPVNSVLLQEVHDDKTCVWYLIPAAIIRSMGQVKGFKTAGFELQTFLKYSAIIGYRCKPRFERNRLVDFEER